MEHCNQHTETRERLIAVEQSAKSAHHRLDSMEKILEVVNQTSLTVRDLTHNIDKAIDGLKEIAEISKNHECRIRIVEERPNVEAKGKLDKIMSKTVTFILGIISAMVLSYLAKKGLI